MKPYDHIQIKNIKAKVYEIQKGSYSGHTVKTKPTNVKSLKKTGGGSRI